MAVTRRQKEILDFLESFTTRNGYSPSFEEIARGMDLKSLATVHKHITNLEKKGLLDRVHNHSRSIDVLPPGARTRSSDRLPLAGRIAAGMPVEAMETEESISLHDVVGNRDVFALEVRGDSMRDDAGLDAINPVQISCARMDAKELKAEFREGHGILWRGLRYTDHSALRHAGRSAPARQ